MKFSDTLTITGPQYNIKFHGVANGMVTALINNWNVKVTLMRGPWYVSRPLINPGMQMSVRYSVYNWKFE